MKQVLTVLALAGLAVACGGDDSGDKPKADSGVDAGGNGNDSGGGKVAKPGAACTVATVAADCGGSAPECGTATWGGIAYPGNYCQATCTSSAECGSAGSCPVGDALALPTIGPIVGSMLMVQSGVCYQKCTVGSGTNDGCRDGYVCETVGTALGGGVANQVPPFAMGTVCLPAAGIVHLPAGDAGAGDAGATTKITGMDAGT